MTTDEFKEEILRCFILSQALEPLADKPGCTTRVVDSSPGTKLEYFIISAVNSTWPILELVDRIISAGRQPDYIFDVAYKAQSRSVRNRNGGKVNYSQILMLLPIVTVQALLFTEGNDAFSVNTILGRTTDAMLKTSSKDVEYLQKFVDLSRQLSEVHHRRLGTKRDYRNAQFTGRYNNILEATHAPDFSDTKMATEIRDGYPDCKHILDIIVSDKENGIIKQSEIAFREMLPAMSRPDIVADCIVVAFYLALTKHRSSLLFP